MSNKSNTVKSAPVKTAPVAEQSSEHSDAVNQLKALVATLGAQQVLLTVGQHITRNAEDFEAGIKYGRRCATLAKKVPALG